MVLQDGDPNVIGSDYINANYVKVLLEQSACQQQEPHVSMKVLHLLLFCLMCTE